MTRREAGAALQRALEISRELTIAADRGDVELTLKLDAERLHLIKSARDAVLPLDARDQAVLREIAELNDSALGFMQHHRRSKGRALDMAVVGRRAVAAYGAVKMHR